MTFDWRSLARNRWAWAGVGVAVLAGGVVWWRGRRGGELSDSTGSARGPATAAPTYSGGPGAIDTTGSDIAGWLGQYQAAQQAQLDNYAAQLSAIQDALVAIQQARDNAGTPPVIVAPPARPRRALPRQPRQLPPTHPQTNQFLARRVGT